MLTRVLVLLWAATTVSAVRAVEIVISAGDVSYPTGTTIVTAMVPRAHQTGGKMALRSESGEHVPVQARFGGFGPLHWMLEAPLAKGASRRYELVTKDIEVSTVECREKNGDCEFSVQGKPVLVYNAELKECPVEGAELCRRSGFIHPVYAPDGAIVSDDFPPDHAHQHGIMLAFVESVFDGKATDFWNSMEQFGLVEHVETVSLNSGPVLATLVTRLAHSQIRSDDTLNPVLNETWRVDVYNSVSPYIFDIQSTIDCATQKPLHLPKYHYGGMAFRGARSWAGGKASFLTSEGKDRIAGNHTRPQWTTITGEIDGKSYTVAGIEFPTNFRYPQPVRLHPEMPYFCWSPQVLGEFDITPGKRYVSRYRFFVFEGKPDAKQLDELAAAMATPLIGTVVN